MYSLPLAVCDRIRAFSKEVEHLEYEAGDLYGLGSSDFADIVLDRIADNLSDIGCKLHFLLSTTGRERVHHVPARLVRMKGDLDDMARILTCLSERVEVPARTAFLGLAERLATHGETAGYLSETALDDEPSA